MIQEDALAHHAPGSEARGTVPDDSAPDSIVSDQAVPGDAPDRDAADLLSRLEVVDSQPLADRAAAYVAIHDELAARLEQNPVSPLR